MDLTVVAPQCHCGHVLNVWSKPAGEPYPRRYCPNHLPVKKRKKYRKRQPCALHGVKGKCPACAQAAEETAKALSSVRKRTGGPQRYDLTDDAKAARAKCAPRFSTGTREKRLAEPLHIGTMKRSE